MSRAALGAAPGSLTVWVGGLCGGRPTGRQAHRAAGPGWDKARDRAQRASKAHERFDAAGDATTALEHGEAVGKAAGDADTRGGGARPQRPAAKERGPAGGEAAAGEEEEEESKDGDRRGDEQSGRRQWQGADERAARPEQQPTRREASCTVVKKQRKSERLCAGLRLEEPWASRSRSEAMVRLFARVRRAASGLPTQSPEPVAARRGTAKGRALLF